jgi:hypothetical protein
MHPDRSRAQIYAEVPGEEVLGRGELLLGHVAVLAGLRVQALVGGADGIEELERLARCSLPASRRSACARSPG